MPRAPASETPPGPWRGTRQYDWAAMNPGIHLVHKPVGPTSFSLVKARLEAIRAVPAGRKVRVCHGGTLDPFASGLLLMLVGQATRLFDHLHAVPKTYEAIVDWGRETDNGDLLGRTTFSRDASGLSEARLDDALGRFVGWRDQVPPATSAKRVDGERAYVRAHRGETVVLPPSRVYLHEARWLGHDLPHQSRLHIVVRGGYYVRSLARDLGRELGCGAHLSELHRSAIGSWTDPGPDQSVECVGRDLLPWAQSRVLSDQDVGDLRRGKDVPTGDLLAPDWTPPPGFPGAENPPIRGFHLGRLAFLLAARGNRLTLLTAFPGGL